MTAEHLAELDRGWCVWRLAALRSAGLPIERLDVLLAPPPAGPGADDRAHQRAAHRRAFDALIDDDLLRAALTWQNPDAVDTWAAAYAAARRAGGNPTMRARRFGHRLAVLTRYAQRYCTKNETIGFFGPVAWARFGTRPSGYTGSGRIRRSSVHVESWAARAVATAWDGDPALAPYLPVRLDPACSVRGAAVARPRRRPHPLTTDEAAVVAALQRGADRAGALPRAAALDAHAAEVAVAALRSAGVVQVGFLIPTGGDPVEALDRQARGVTDDGLRGELVDRLDRVRAACAAAARSATAPDEVRTALDAASEALDTAAGGRIHRQAGHPARGRTPVYLDCRRDLDAVVDERTLAALAGPLGVLLDSARWLCGQVAEVAEDRLRHGFRQLRATRDEVTVADLWMAVADVLEPGGDAFAEVVEDFRLRWAEILGPCRGEPVQLDEAGVRRLADALFPAPRTLWAAARMHSPDVMLRRCGDGSLDWVVGEVHVALNTLESRFFSVHADDPAELVGAVAADIAPGRVVPLYPGSARDVSSRSYPPPSLDPPGRYRYVSFGSDDGHPTGARGTPATALTVVERAGVLLATCASEGWEAPVVECFGEHLSAAAVNLFTLRAPARHAPRVTIGRVTVCRETWRMPLVDLAAGADRARDPAQDGLRRVLLDRGVDRHVFARVGGDPKPFYVDLCAPLLLDNLARAARRALERAGSAAAEAVLVEMLPSPSELWLRLPDGTYTSELRLVAVDPQPAQPASWLVAAPPSRAAAGTSRG